jgi:hypothetical protein
MKLSVTSTGIFKSLLACIAALAVMHCLALLAETLVGGKLAHLMWQLFDLNHEANFPTLFSVLQLLLCSGMLLLIHKESRSSGRREGFYWLALAAVFAYLSVDELCELHERLIEPMRRLLKPTGALSFAWVIPYSGLALIFGGFFIRFWWRLPPRYRLLVAIAGVFYVGGAIGMEMVGSYLFTRYGWQSIQFNIETLFEEVVEMASISLFIFALSELLFLRVGSITVAVPGVVASHPNQDLIADVLEDRRANAA